MIIVAKIGLCTTTMPTGCSTEGLIGPTNGYQAAMLEGDEPLALTSGIENLLHDDEDRLKQLNKCVLIIGIEGAC